MSTGDQHLNYLPVNVSQIPSNAVITSASVTTNTSVTPPWGQQYYYQTLDEYGKWSNSWPTTTITYTYPPFTTEGEFNMFQIGDRVTIKEGYEGAGKLFIYLGKSNNEPNIAVLKAVKGVSRSWVLFTCLEAKPYTAKEKAKAFAKKHGLNKKAEKALRKIIS